MKKVILPQAFRLLFEILGMGVILSIPMMSYKPVDTEQNNDEIAIETDAMKEPVRYISEKQLAKLYTCKDEEINDTCLCLSVEDAEMLMKIAVAEDHTDETSQAYVMSIILNRVDSPDFPDTVAEVIEQPGQFMKLTDKRYLNSEPDVNSHLALALIEGKQIETNFLYYEAKWVKNSWASRHREVALEYGGSRFYK